jgi:hypothetical protein
MSDVFDSDNIIDREALPATWRASPPWSHPISDCIFRQRRVRGSAAAVGQKLIDGIPMNPRRMANVLNTKPELLLEFCGPLTTPGDETVVLFADGKPVEIQV